MYMYVIPTHTCMQSVHVCLYGGIQPCFQRSKGEGERSGWHDPQSHEEEPTSLEAGIKIQNLSKIYDPVSFLCVCSVCVGEGGVVAVYMCV